MKPYTLMIVLLALCFGGYLHASEPGSILIVVGPTNHPPGTHEVAAGGRLIKHCLENMEHKPRAQVEIVYQWPTEQQKDAAASIVFLGDTFPANRLPNAAQNLADLEKMMNRGCGIVCVHYATGLLGEDVQADGDHPLLRWMGGYFANRSCPHHESFAKIFPAATIQPAAAEHAIWRGAQEFTLHDEPYTNNYFGTKDNQPAANVTILATSMLPPENPKPEPVAWCTQRADGGRGFAVVMPHFYRSWENEDLRRFILNGIVWSAGQEVPATGVRTTLPDLGHFRPEAVDPKPPRPSQPKPTSSKSSSTKPTSYQLNVPSNSEAPAAQTAKSIDLTHWKLTLPLPKSDKDDSLPLEISAADLAAGYQHPKYFLVSPDGALVFWCPVTGVTTANTKYPRTELREVLDPSDDNVCWKSEGTHELVARCRVLELPSSGKVIVGQIHAFGDHAKPLVKLQMNRGRLEALVKENSRRDAEIKLTLGDIGLDRDFDYAIKLKDGKLSVTVNGQTKSVEILDNDPNWAKQSLYFKAGAYTQDNAGPASEGARVQFSKLTVSHSP